MTDYTKGEKYMYDIEAEIEKLQPKSDSERLLLKLAFEGAEKKYAGSLYTPEKIKDQLEFELSVMFNMNVADYILVVQDFLNIARHAGHMPDDRFYHLKSAMYDMSIKEMTEYIMADQSYPGMTVGPGRGSAAGSMVTYAVGIASIEPLSNGLLFERFLNPERQSMPDIDSDLSKSEYDYGTRDIAIEYCAKKYGRNALCGITVPSTLAVKAAIKNVARMIGDREAEKAVPKTLRVSATALKEKREEISHQYLNLADRINDKVPSDPNASFNMKIDDTITLRQSLNTAFVDDKMALEIIDDANQLEGVNINWGKHACGVIISDNGDIGAYYPLMFDTKANGWKIQLNASQSEAAGLLKMDFLGLKNLNVITKTVREVYKNRHEYLEPLTFPQDPDVYSKIYAVGKTQSIFQFESPGMKQMLKRFKPTCFSDIVTLVACYRPGPLQYLDGIIARKNGEKAEENAVTRIASYCPAFSKIVEPTYMALVYQEQIMSTFRLAGYSLGNADLVRRSMGHKDRDAMVREKPKFIKGAIAVGIKEQDADDLFEEMIDFSSYAFNKSHAAAYAMTSYITAYLKLHYGAEYYAAVLSFEDLAKYPALIAEAKSFGINVKGPDINESADSFVGKDNTIYFGFSGIKGICKGLGTTKFPSIAEFVLGSDVENSVMQSLVKVGAFDSLCQNRAAIIDMLPTYMKDKSDIKSKYKRITSWQEQITDLDNGIPLDRKKYKITTKSVPNKATLEAKIKKDQDAIQLLSQEIKSINLPLDVADYKETHFKWEKELLGLCVSGNPIDLYGTASELGATDISEALDMLGGSVSIFGQITNLRITKQRKDATKELAFFNLEDASGTIPVCCFTEAFVKYNKLLQDGEVVILKGELNVRQETSQFIIDSKLPGAVKTVSKKQSNLIVSVNGLDDLSDHLIPAITPFLDEHGHKLHVRDKQTGDVSCLKGRFSSDVLNIPGFYFKNA